jgi:hypothetical protein
MLMDVSYPSLLRGLICPTGFHPYLNSDHRSKVVFLDDYL